ncbi:MAG: bifunctional UDP-N-acetylglucosamine diphosphorylase/glucosamine-1-phosphate N-acetyltransferase GlmU [bacterium]
MKGLAALILAAGKSTRMKSSRSKVLHELAGRPVISYPIEVARRLGARQIVVVRGADQLDLKEYLEGVGVAAAVQKEPLGTGHAVLAAEKALAGFSGQVLILCGDVPLIRAEMLRSFVEEVRSASATLGVLTMMPADPGAYGRIVRDLDGRMTSIVEARDATHEERKIREVNSGIICADAKWLFSSLRKVKNDNAKGEYYLTDLVGIALKEDVSVVAHLGEPALELHGINTRVDLANVIETMRERINRNLMLDGVGIIDYRHTYIDSTVRIGVDTKVMPFSFLQGDTKIGRDCTIENGVVIRNAVVGNGVHIKAHSVIDESRIADGAVVGPFSRVRPGSVVGHNAHVGNFVELKKCVMKEGAKANHLTYLGDATIGARANVGCGTITCNYDGVAKYRTIIGDEAFIGSDTQFVAPVRVGKGAIIGAGSTITKDVPADALALSRVPQTNVKGWAAKCRKKRKKGD